MNTDEEITYKQLSWPLKASVVISLVLGGFYLLALIVGFVLGLAA